MHDNDEEETVTSLDFGPEKPRISSERMSGCVEPRVGIGIDNMVGMSVLRVCHGSIERLFMVWPRDRQ